MEQNIRNVSPYSNESRNTYVIRHITDSMLELLKEKPLQEISISELCSKAQVGRTSFYRNFSSKEDIVIQHIQTLFQEWMPKYKTYPEFPGRELIQDLFSHFEKHRDFYALLNERNLVYLLKDIILDLCRFDPNQVLPLAYASSYAGYFLYGWTEVWFLRGMKDSTEELMSYLPEQPQQ